MKRLPLMLALLALPGCNAVLGIEEPSSAMQPGPGGYDASLSDGETPYDPDAGVAADAEALPVLPASPYARAAWPMPSGSHEGLPHTQKYLTEEPGVVRDQVTNLAWEQPASSKAITFEEASSYCDGLSLAGGGFRLPSRIELTSLLNLEQTVPALDHAAFPDSISDKLWTSSAFAGGANQRWLVNFGFGVGLVSSANAAEKHQVRCVQSATDAEPASRMLEIEATTVRDPNTELTWQRAVGVDMVTLSDALTACAALNLDGGGFRLPSVKELHTLVDERRIKTAIDPEAFPDTPSSYFWTSSKVVGFAADYTWMVSFTDGTDRWVTKEILGNVRCVRATPSLPQ